MPPLDVKFRNNIKIISVNDFAKFINLDNKGLDEDFKKLVKLVESINKSDDENFRFLEDLYRKAKKRLKLLEMYKIRHKDLEIILMQDKLYDLLRMPK